MTSSTAGHMARLKCDMCGKPLKSRRFQIQVFMRPEKTMVVGPDCYKKEKAAVEVMKSRFTEEQLNARRAAIAAAKGGA
jgi:hypothetical protein